MTKNFLIINCIGEDDILGLKIEGNFFTHTFDSKTRNNDQLVTSILNLVKKYKVNFNNDFSILVNSGPGSFSSIRVSLAVAKGIRLLKKVNLFGYKNSDLGFFSLANIELLIKKKLIDKNLLKPLYLS
ncbi:hypothetical protein N9N34_00480 [Candidatus Pelagibacter bacterium]|nr:hypothetical protein [Candidatus Pelagibacter bacterium]